LPVLASTSKRGALTNTPVCAVAQHATSRSAASTFKWRCLDKWLKSSAQYWMRGCPARMLLFKHSIAVLYSVDTMSSRSRFSACLVKSSTSTGAAYRSSKSSKCSWLAA
jgi:hypothetical protein